MVAPGGGTTTVLGTVGDNVATGMCVVVGTVAAWMSGFLRFVYFRFVLTGASPGAAYKKSKRYPLTTTTD